MFSSNKIIGFIKIKPDRASKLIRNFVVSEAAFLQSIIEHIFVLDFQFVINRGDRYEFDRNIRKLAAIGFDSTRGDLSLHIEAIPINKDWKPKKSDEQVCSLKVFDLIDLSLLAGLYHISTCLSKIYCEP